MTIPELALLIFGTGTGGSAILLAISHAIRHVPIALANARLTNADAKLKEQEIKEKTTDIARVAVETVKQQLEAQHDWQEDTGRTILAHREETAEARKEAATAKKNEHDCQEALAKLDSECKQRDEVHTARARAQAHELKNVRAALGLVLSSADATKSLPPEALKEVVAKLRLDDQKQTASEK